MRARVATSCLGAPTAPHPERAVRQPNECISNLKQLQTGWQLYAGDFNDITLPNAPLGSTTDKARCYGQTEDWHFAAPLPAETLNH